MNKCASSSSVLFSKSFKITNSITCGSFFSVQSLEIFRMQAATLTSAGYLLLPSRNASKLQLALLMSLSPLLKPQRILQMLAVSLLISSWKASNSLLAPQMYLSLCPKPQNNFKETLRCKMFARLCLHAQWSPQIFQKRSKPSNGCLSLPRTFAPSKRILIFKERRDEGMNVFFCSKSLRRPWRVHSPAIYLSAPNLRFSKTSKMQQSLDVFSCFCPKYFPTFE